jgi:crotonobetaine/carnitine-CoA ligase
MAADVGEAVFSRVVTTRAARDPDGLVFLFENGRLPAERVTAADLAVRGNQLAWALRRVGLRAGDRVAIVTHNHPEVVYGLVAGAKLGVPVVLLDPRWGSERLDPLLRRADCSAVLTADYLLADPAFAEVVRRSGAAAFALSTPEGRAGGLDPSPEWPVLNEVLDGPERGDAGEYVTDPAAPWLVAFAGGKAVELAHDRLPFFRLVPGLFGYRADDVPYTGLSLSGGNALAVTMLPAVLGAVRHSVFSRTLSVARLWDVCIDYGCTTWSNVGGMAAAVYREPSNGRDRAHPVRLVVSAGMHREMWRPFEERFGVRVLEWHSTPLGIPDRVRYFEDRDEGGWLSFAFRPDHDGELVLKEAVEAPLR